jgi:Large polyvalent protein-associated domain 7
MAEQGAGGTEFSIEREAPSRHGSQIAERARNGPRLDADTEGRSDRSMEPDAFPDRIRRKYYVVADEGRGTERDGSGPVGARVYADAKGEYLAFKDTGARLTTRLGGADVARDMVAVAVHRGWETLRVRGSASFRREAWLEASARGLEVRGYEPTDIDRAVLTKRTAQMTSRGEPDRRRRASAPEKSGAPGPTAADRTSDPLRTGRERPDVLAAKPQDARGSSGRRETSDRTAGGLADRFRRLGPAEAVRDPALAAAHSQLAVLERSLRDVFPTDARARSVVLEAARERIAEHLERGRTFRRAEVRVPGPERESARSVERAAFGPDRPRERAKVRERARDR